MRSAGKEAEGRGAGVLAEREGREEREEREERMDVEEVGEEEAVVGLEEIEIA